MFKVGARCRILLLCSIVLLLANSTAVQAQSPTGPSPDSFPIGLVLEYDSTSEYFPAVAQSGSGIRYEVISWVNDQVVFAMNVSGSGYADETWLVELPEWSIVSMNGTPTAAYMDPLWVNTTSFGESQLTIPPLSPYSRTYSLTLEARSVPEGTFTCWRCRTSWDDQGTDVYKHLYYEVDLGVLVETWQAGFPPIELPDYGMGGYQFRDKLAESNIQSFILAKGLGSPSSSTIGVAIWLLCSMAVVAIPIIILVRPERGCHEREFNQ